MYSIVEFNDEKWFVIAEKDIDGIKYSYMIQINDTEDDFLDKYVVVKSHFVGEDEYMDVVNENLDRIMPILVPESIDYINNHDMLKKLLKEIEN